jgi:hypothetical protein
MQNNNFPLAFSSRVIFLVPSPIGFKIIFYWMTALRDFGLCLLGKDIEYNFLYTIGLYYITSQMKSTVTQ